MNITDNILSVHLKSENQVLCFNITICIICMLFYPGLCSHLGCYILVSITIASNLLQVSVVAGNIGISNLFNLWNQIFLTPLSILRGYLRSFYLTLRC